MGVGALISTRVRGYSQTGALARAHLAQLALVHELAAVAGVGGEQAVGYARERDGQVSLTTVHHGCPPLQRNAPLGAVVKPLATLWGAARPCAPCSPVAACGACEASAATPGDGVTNECLGVGVDSSLPDMPICASASPESKTCVAAPLSETGGV